MGLTAIELPEEATPAGNGEPVCPICGGLGFIKYDLPTSHVDFGQFQPCPNTEWHASDRTARLLATSGLLEGEQETPWTLDSLEALGGDARAMAKLLRAWLNRPRGWLYLWGPYGNGKTIALQAAVREFCERGIPAYYSVFSDLLDVMRHAFEKPSARGDADPEAWQRYHTYLSRFNRLRDIPLLAIDEFDPAKYSDTPWVSQFRGQLVDARYRTAILEEHAEQTYTLWAANESPDSLPGYIRDRIRDKRFIVYHYAGESKRASAMWYNDI
jgi:DNA replication protein DnaC